MLGLLLHDHLTSKLAGSLTATGVCAAVWLQLPCPEGYFCRQGSTEPDRCPPGIRCLPSTEVPDNAQTGGGKACEPVAAQCQLS